MNGSTSSNVYVSRVYEIPSEMRWKIVRWLKMIFSRPAWLPILVAYAQRLPILVAKILATNFGFVPDWLHIDNDNIYMLSLSI